MKKPETSEMSQQGIWSGFTVLPPVNPSGALRTQARFCPQSRAAPVVTILSHYGNDSSHLMHGCPDNLLTGARVPSSPISPSG